LSAYSGFGFAVEINIAFANSDFRSVSDFIPQANYIFPLVFSTDFSQDSEKQISGEMPGGKSSCMDLKTSASRSIATLHSRDSNRGTGVGFSSASPGDR
jgi:hypothetical protein